MASVANEVVLRGAKKEFSTTFSPLPMYVLKILYIFKRTIEHYNPLYVYHCQRTREEILSLHHSYPPPSSIVYIYFGNLLNHLQLHNAEKIIQFLKNIYIFFIYIINKQQDFIMKIENYRTGGTLASSLII